jgi:hypothetical protein
MRFYRTLGHVQLFCDLRVIATLEEQFGNLPFSGAQTNHLFIHALIPFLNKMPNQPSKHAL